MMGRNAKLPDHATRPHDTRWPISDEECGHLKEKYGFQNKDSGFCYKLNFALSWIDIYKESEERPINESSKLLKQIHICSKRLKELLKKKKAEYFYKGQPVINGIKGLLPVLGVGRYGLSGRVYMQCLSASDRRNKKNELNRKYRNKKEWNELVAEWEKRQAEINQQARESNRTPDLLKSPKEKRECLNAMNIPPDSLCRSVRSSTERLFTAIDCIGNKEIKIIFDSGGELPQKADLPGALSWLADASKKPAVEVSDNMVSGRPTILKHLKMIEGLWFLFENGRGCDKNSYPQGALFQDFLLEVLPKVQIYIGSLEDRSYLSDLIKKTKIEI